MGVIIGYSLEDPDFRAVLAWIRARLGVVPPDLYVLEVEADSAKVDRYTRRGVRVVNLKSDGQGWGILEDLFQALADYWHDQVPSRVASPTTIGRTVLRARPRLSRVSLFMVSHSRLSDFDASVFPIIIDQE